MKKENSYPVRYSLRPTDRRLITENLKKNGGATLGTIRALAKRKKVATKVIHDILVQNHLPILPEGTPMKIKSAKQRTEEVFSRFADKPEEAFSEPPKVCDKARELEEEVLTSLQDMEASLLRERDEALEILAERERQLAAEVTQAENLRGQARQAVEHVSALRRRTKSDREELETLKGNYSALLRSKRASEDALNTEIELWKSCAQDLGKDLFQLLQAFQRTLK